MMRSFAPSNVYRKLQIYLRLFIARRKKSHLLESVFNLIQEKALYMQEKRTEARINLMTPEELRKKFDFNMTHGHSSFGSDPEKRLVEILEGLMSFCNQPSHPFYQFIQILPGVDAYGMIGDFISALKPCGMRSDTEATACEQLLMEQEIIRAVRNRIGYSAQGTDNRLQSLPSGLMWPGGSISIISAIYAARHIMFPETKRSGVVQSAGNLTLYVSKNPHYCFKKGAILLGLGLRNCVLVDVDDAGRMDGRALRQEILKTKAAGDIPFFVGATEGTTILGSFDRLLEIRAICDEFGIWMHAVGSLGGAVMMSDKYSKRYLKGIELADSMNFNPYKWFGVALECSILVFERDDVLQRVFGGDASNNNKEEDLFEIFSGLQNDRRPTALKFCLLWKA
jgi:hypothetical protein